MKNEQPFKDSVEDIVTECIPTPPPPPLQALQHKTATPPQLSWNVIKVMKVAELRSELKSLNKAVSGSKDVLIQRLLSCINIPHIATAVVVNDKLPAFNSHHGVRWRLHNACVRNRSRSKEV